MSQKTKVLHIVDALSYGGAQKLLVLLAQWTSKDRYEVSFCVLQPGPPDLKEEIESFGSRVICLDRPRPSVLCPHLFLSYVWGQISDIVKFCRREGISIVQCHLSDAELLGIPAAVLAEAGLVLATNHYPYLPYGRSRFDPRNLVRRLLCKILYNTMADMTITVSEDYAKRLIEDFGVKPEKVRVIANGIDVQLLSEVRASGDLRNSLGLTSGDIVVVSVGRLSREKGHRFLIEAISKLTGEFPDLKLLLVGDGDLRRELGDFSSRLCLDANVRFLGARRDVADILALADIFALPSIREGTALALLEAMAAGKPVITTRHPGNLAVIRHLENGYLVAPGDPAALAKAISFLLKNPEKAAELGNNALQTVRLHFEITRTVAQLEAIYSTVPVARV